MAVVPMNTSRSAPEAKGTNDNDIERNTTGILSSNGCQSLVKYLLCAAAGLKLLPRFLVCFAPEQRARTPS
eukprot:4197479-Amphidinium_carterae.1